jgi:hypothetical protein
MQDGDITQRHPGCGPANRFQCADNVVNGGERIGRPDAGDGEGGEQCPELVITKSVAY